MPAGEKQVNCLHLHSAIMGAAWLAGHSVPRGQPCMRHYRRSRRACSREWVSRAVAATGALFDGFLTQTAPVLLLLRWQIVVAVHNTKWTINTAPMPGHARLDTICCAVCKHANWRPLQLGSVLLSIPIMHASHHMAD